MSNLKIFLFFCVIGLVGCGHDDAGAQNVSGFKVTAEKYGASWPFTVESGAVDCVNGNAAVFKANGLVYQLNGIASSMGYKPIDPIWKDNPEIPGTKVSVGEMIQLALKQCK